MDSVFLLAISIFLYLTYDEVTCERQDINSLLYEKFDNAASCFRLLNATHQFGCSSSVSGNLGVIHFIQAEEDVDWVVKDGKAGPYMAIVSPRMFNKRDLMVKLQQSPDVSGVLLAINGSQDRPESFSPDDTCPNRYSGDGTCTGPWNPQGTSYLLMDWNKPVFVVKDPEVISKIYECFNKFNRPFDDCQSRKPLCSLQMRSHMHAAVNTPTCIRRSKSFNVFNPLTYCDGMGDRNIISTLKPIKENPSNRSMILISTRLDTGTMFDGVVHGAMTTMTGLVTFLAAAKLITSMLPPHEEYEKNIIFAMFNGEMYDYIGSGRTVYSIKNQKFPTKTKPIDFHHIGLMVDVSQMSKSTSLYCHSMKNDLYTNATEFCETLRNNSGNILKVIDEVDTVLPSSSVHSFLKQDKTIPAIVLANHGKQYINRYYNGIMDNATNIDYKYFNGTHIPNNTVQVALAEIATTISKTMYTIVTGKKYNKGEAVQPSLIDELLHCYLESGQCSIFQDATSHTDKLPPDASPLYVGVYKSSNTITQLTAVTLALFTSEETNITEAECKSKNTDYNYYWMNGPSRKGECRQTTVRLKKAYSPAFEIDDYDWSSREYSTWSESVWQDMRLRMFLKPSRQQELTTLVLGLVTLALSFIVVYWVKSQAHLLFHVEVSVAC